jgi:predicted O-methyltransferase YrrM
MTLKTTKWVEIATAELENQDTHYRSVYGNLNPIDFFKLLNKRANKSLKELPAYSILNNFDYFKGNRDLNQVWSAEPDVSRFVADIAFLLDAQTVLETGSFVGATTTHIAYALSALGGKRKLYFVDVEQRFLDLALHNISTLGLNALDLYPVCGSTLSDAIISSLHTNFDLMFLDSEHVETGLWKEIQIFLPKLSPKGILLIHDSIRWPGVRRCLLRMQDTHHILNFATSNRNGVSAIIPKSCIKDFK